LTAAETGTVRCTGLSYKDHAAELGMPYPAFPILFYKPGTTLTDPGSDVVVPFICQNEEVDWEVELCVVIGKDCKNVSEDEAMDHVLGYTVANDVGHREL
jgi:2-keto-4-pentenoate hydratase/2-oxohepta-3-ene-1,7-dioic acid hydratase in catechol pathway